MTSRAAGVYKNLVFGKPYLIVALLLATVAFFAWHAQDFRLDA